MAYDGNVKVGGAPAVRELAGLTLTKVSVGRMDNNAYLLRCRETGEQVLIDAADDAGTLIDLLGGAPLARVVTTHRHGDHWQALAEVVRRTGAATAAHVDDAPGIKVPTTEPLHDGDEIRVGSCVLTVTHLVGHTPGSVALCYDEPGGRPHLFTGDSLFPGGVGNTHGSRKDFTRLIDDVEHKLFDRLPDETWVYPGHGADTTLGAERPHLPEWRARGW
ncbi:MBL fold metallo-hydrolase [Actinopolymorpha rutila]|uniref:Glyoxylase-like metal-dependent hydrolase (Beta-lactamase superfamily II) n=1 Tax=Actinopolymorpha rutila TaxID=446787 RepID=A0A852ZG98_9ACTN|nr:MBL fold metallo-hydrolase [Actinopolymorpha rutila]NYH90702.1 glyoxylase-like metal-dependent hydrolase (beta-lactamase superfamily II) [Actinopolymorpha rutila]